MRIMREYIKNRQDRNGIMMDEFYDAWMFLCGHPIFVNKDDPTHDASEWYFTRNLDIEVVKVNPETDEIDDIKTKNTKTSVWLECGTNKDHDIDLDCGGDTFEEAIIKLAELVKRKYGDYNDGYSNGQINLEPRVLVEPFEISEETLAVVDKSMENFKKGIASEPVGLS